MCKPGVFDPRRFEFNEKPPLQPKPTLSFGHRVILALRKKGAINAIVKEPGVRRDADETSGPSTPCPDFSGRSVDSERARERQQHQGLIRREGLARLCVDLVREGLELRRLRG